MSDMYAIKSSTLTAIGDAIRNKTSYIKSQIVPLTNPINFHFDGASVDSSQMEFDGSYYYLSWKYNVPGAKTLTINYSGHKEYTCDMFVNFIDELGNKISGWQVPENLIDISGTKELTCNSEMFEIRYQASQSHISYIYSDNMFLDISVKDVDGNLLTETEQIIQVPNTMTPMEMAEKINGLDTIPDEALTITGDCNYRFANGGWDWFINFYGNKITTLDITNVENMFYNAAGIEAMPFEINLKKSSTYHDLEYMFFNTNIKEIPKINNAIPYDIDYIFSNCKFIRYLPEDIGEWFDWSYMEKQTSEYSCSKSNMFASCNSLRKVPMGLLNRANPNVNYSYSYFNGGFENCYSLDELVGLPIPYTAATWTSNAFYNTFYNCHRLKEITFALQEDGTPYIMNWTKQTIDLSRIVGYFESTYNLSYVLNYNSGITADKEVKDDTTYQALKNDPDWFTIDATYSRYNHDSAVNTINSLPDCSAKGGNTIKFNGAQGSLTDGGAINTLTEAEIAVATAKGWTVSLV